MTPSALAQALRHRLARLAHDERGVSAVEFAVLLPFMFLLYMGGVEVSQAVATDRKVTMVARSVADLVSRTTSVSDSDITDTFNAGAAVVAPFVSSKLKVTLSSVSINAQGVAKVVWSDGYNTTARAVGSTVTVPTALNVANTSLIWGEVSYAYTPTIGYVLTGTMNLTDQMYMRPRLSTCVTRVTSSGSVC
jgi:Flp pilus assembly protein TadG